MNEDIYDLFITKSLTYCQTGFSDYEFSESLNILVEALKGKEIESIVADILWLVDSMLGDSLSNEIRDNFLKIVKLCQKNIGLNSAFLKDRLSDDILDALQLVNSNKNNSTQFTKTNKRTFSHPKKFNLIHDANEGFSKLIVELIIFDSQPILMAEKIKSLIGYFDLDANRVIDLILDVVELRLDKSAQFVQLLCLLNADKQDITDLIGQKLIGNTSDSIFELIVVLVRHEVIDLMSIYEYLSPTDDIIKTHYDKDMETARSRKFNNNFTSKLKDDSKTSVDEQDDLKIDDRDYADNQKIRLCLFFLKYGHWPTVKVLISLLPPYFALRYPPFCKMLCNKLHIAIEPLYNRCCPLSDMLKYRRHVVSTPTDSFDVVHEFEELNKTVFEISNYLGPMLSTDQILFTKFMRITHTYFLECKSKALNYIDQTYQGFFNLLNLCLLPSLSLLHANVSLAEEMWDAVKYLPYDVRYSLYVYWNDVSDDDHPALIQKKRSVQSQIRHMLKRLSKENVKQMGRQIGKLCHCNPGIVFPDVLNTILIFSNLTVPVVDTVKYLGSLSLDMLMFCILEILVGDRVKMEEAQQSQWQQVMSTFVGLLCKKYQFDLVGLFQLILNKIKDGHCSDLIIIKEVLQKMTGIEVNEDITDDQLEALSGGEVLRQEVGYFVQMRNVRKTSSRLKDLLIEHNLAIPYVIMLSQERNLLVHTTCDVHLKVIGRLYDQCHDTMLQMASFVSLQWSANEMANNCPGLTNLLKDYKMDPDIAFSLYRSIFHFKIQERINSVTNESGGETTDDAMEFYATTSQTVLEEFVQDVVPNFSQEIWDDFNSSFYTTFWLLQSSDLMVPDAAYKKQELLLRTQMKQMELDNSLSALKKQKEIDRYSAIIEKLQEESKRGEIHVKLVDHWLESVKGRWFVKNKSGAAKAIVMTRFIELCVFPRVCFSSSDAIFVANLIYKLHCMKTPAFSTLICLDRIFNDITLMISTCSENEAKRYGRFMDAVLNMIMKWHSSEDIYNKECVSHPGFVTVFRKNTDGNNKADQLTFENYRHVLHKWHYRVTKSIVACLESDNYVQIRNCLLLLERLLNNYPRVLQFGQAIERRIELLRDKEKRPDLYALTQSYFGHMVAKKPLWLQDKDFHQKDETRVSLPKTAVPNGDRTASNGTADGKVVVARKEGSLTKRSTGVDDKDVLESKRRKPDPAGDEKTRVTRSASATKKNNT